jgi:hypothetical protein
MMGAGLSQSRVSLGHIAAPLRRPQELTRMPKDKSILLVANARPFEIGKLYFFRDRGMQRLMARTAAATVDPPNLRSWSESSAWLEAHSGSVPASKAAQADSAATPASLTNEGSVDAGPQDGSGTQAAKERSAIDVEILEAITEISAEAQHSGHSVSGEQITSALQNLGVIAEKIRKGWTAA